MHDVHGEPIDLNLLLVLDELLRTGRVAEAARRLGRTPSAVSHALARLRVRFRDPLLVRVGTSLAPTTRARELTGPVAEVCARARDLLAAHVPLDHAALRRRFTIDMADWSAHLIVPPLLARIGAVAPGVELHVTTSGPAVDRRLQAGDIDLAIGARYAPIAGLVQQKLFEEQNLGAVRRDHPRIRGTLSRAQLRAADHVVVAPRGDLHTFVDELLAGAPGRVVARVPQYLLALHLAAHTDYLAIAPARLVRAVAPTLHLRILRPPDPLGSFWVTQTFTEQNRSDRALAWLRGLVAEVARAL